MPRPSPSSLHSIDHDDRSVGIDTDHHKVHEGERFTVYNKTVLALAGVLDILLVVPANIQSHLLFEVVGQRGGVVDVYRGTTVSANGSAIPKWNKSDEYATALGSATFYTGPTITDIGTQITALNFAVGRSAGGTASFAGERNLGPSLNYLFRVTSDAASNRVITTFDWYEHEV